jgi:pimeloyl-ACP methyl ester carboxylesterase
MVRGQAQDVYYFPAEKTPSLGQVLFLPGDGGWHGFAITIAKSVSEWGYDVYGVDTKHYLCTSTTMGGLTEAQVSSDMAELARSLGAHPGRKFTLLGWSEGAGLSLLAAAAEKNRSSFNGLITTGLPEKNILAWRWEDALTYVTKQRPNEPGFSSADFMGKISPLPVVMIQSTNDEYVSMDAAQRLFQAAHDPRRFSPVSASNHRFGGNQQQFFNVLQDGLRWIQQQSR